MIWVERPTHRHCVVTFVEHGYAGKDAVALATQIQACFNYPVRSEFDRMRSMYNEARTRRDREGE